MRTFARTMALVTVFGAVSETAFAQQAAVITFLDNGARKIYAFVAAPNGHLKVRYGYGSSWNWADQGLPNGVTAVTDPAAITYIDSTGKRRIYVFAIQVGGFNGSRLHVNYWNGNAWNWAFLGGPLLSDAGPSITGLSAITYLDETGNQRIYVFARDTNGHLIAHHWNGSAWSVEDHGLPPGGGLAFIHAITYANAGNRVIDVFCSPGETGSNQWLSLRRFISAVWNAWFWTNQGGPESPGVVNAITYVDDGMRQIHAFAAGTSPLFSSLSSNYWTGTNWGWADLGGAFASPSAITYGSGGSRRIYVFGLGVVFTTTHIVNHLRIKYWNGTWYTVNHGTIGDPNNSLEPPTAITYADSEGNRHIDVFAVMQNEVATELGLKHLVERRWDGSSWSWIHHGLF